VAPSGRLIFDTQGALYGTTVKGGSARFPTGSVFKLTPPASGTGSWTETQLDEFSAGDGSFGGPTAGLIFDTQGALYGTGNGLPPPVSGRSMAEVFKLTLSSSATGMWTETTLFSTGISSLTGDLTFDTRGALYSVTSGGTVFKLTPPASGTGPWTKTVLYSLPGAVGHIALIFDTQGSLYGTTANGGSSKNGTAFQLTPPASGTGPWTETVLHTFSGSDGANPQAGLIFGPGGVLYGTTYAGGKSGNGTVFQISNPSCSSAGPGQSLPY
jgi:uncharacterized repeat protein (TIGR03803 family)